MKEINPLIAPTAPQIRVHNPISLDPKPQIVLLQGAEIVIFGRNLSLSLPRWMFLLDLHTNRFAHPPYVRGDKPIRVRFGGAIQASIFYLTRRAKNA
jgi:hypothetical protein